MCTKDTIKLDYKFSFFPYLIEIGFFVIAIFRHINNAKTTFNCHLWPCIIQFQIWSLLILIFISFSLHQVEQRFCTLNVSRSWTVKTEEFWPKILSVFSYVNIRLVVRNISFKYNSILYICLSSITIMSF